MSVPPRTVVLVGLGAAGADHCRALEHIPGAVLVAGVDVDASRRLAFRGRDVRVHASVFDLASERDVDPDIVVVATPTPTHAQVCAEVSEYFRKATILVEKPAADSLGDAQRIVDGVGGEQPVQVAYHLAFSPEVDWALAQAGDGRLGRPVAVESWNCDPYHSDLASARARFGTSWIDSGINALSVIERFATVVERSSLRQAGPAGASTFQGVFACEAHGGEAHGGRLPALVITSWHGTAPAHSTRIRYSGGAELVMDHHAVAGYLLDGAQVLAQFGTDGTVPRRQAHYRALYRSWLIDRSQIFTMDTSLRLHRLLLES